MSYSFPTSLNRLSLPKLSLPSSSSPLIVQGLALFGAASLALSAAKLTRFLYRTFVYRFDFSQLQTKEGGRAWALVTGASAGIGEGFASELARRGFNLLLVSRSLDRLQGVADRITAQYPGTQVRLVVSDAASLDDVALNLDGIVQAASQVPLSVLVNNVGAAYDAFLADTLDQQIDETIFINCRFQTLLTKRIIPYLSNRKQTKKSAIVNVASRSGVFHYPFLSVYSASKSYNIGLAHALRAELADTGIEVLNFMPSRVVSNMSGFKEPQGDVCSAVTSANGALNAIGLRDHAGWWMHQFLWKAWLWVPDDARDRYIFDARKGDVEALAKAQLAEMEARKQPQKQ